MTFGIYIHIPFCKKRCNYCDFISSTYNQDLALKYVDALCKEIEASGKSYKKNQQRARADTIYIGGGTPSVLYEGAIEQIISEVRLAFCVDANAEITIECNPESIDYEKGAQMRQAGINRVSIGVQSLNDSALKWAGRLHTAAQALEAIDILKAAGFINISSDLILGLENDNEKTVINHINKLNEAGVKHISVYGLKVEQNTPLFESGFCVDEDNIARLYECASSSLVSLGFKRYEISNFAKEGYYSRHNLKYWRYKPYLGFGLGAVSMLNKKRWRNNSDLNNYIGANYIESKEALTKEQCATEFLMLGLRLSEGVDLAQLKERFGLDLKNQRREALKKLLEDGVVELEQNKLRISEEFMYLENSVLLKLL